MTFQLCQLKCTGSEKGLGRWVSEETEYQGALSPTRLVGTNCVIY